MKKNILIFLVSLFVLSGCFGNPQYREPSNFDELSDKGQVSFINKRNLYYLYDGNLKGMVNAFSVNYVDLGGGSDGAGNVDIEANYRGLFASERFKERAPKINAEDVFDFDNEEIYTHKEFSDLGYDRLRRRVDFVFLEGDIMILVPPKTTGDGYSAFYRKEQGEWKIIAAD